VKKTAWFPAHIRPVRKGVYEIKRPRTTYAYWNGQFWSYEERWINFASEMRLTHSTEQYKTWRGLTKEHV